MSGAVLCPRGGVSGAGGVVFPNSQVRISDILDGTTNVMAVSERGDFITTANGTKAQYQAGCGYGFQMGVSGSGIPPSSNAAADNPTSNLTTIRYGINRKTGPGSHGLCNGAATLGFIQRESMRRAMAGTGRLGPKAAPTQPSCIANWVIARSARRGSLIICCGETCTVRCLENVLPKMPRRAICARVFKRSPIKWITPSRTSSTDRPSTWGR